MNKEVLFDVSPWTFFSRKLISKILLPRFIGHFSEEEAKAKGMRLAVGTSAREKEGVALSFYWLVDETDGVIADAKFEVLGPPSLIGAAEIASEFFMRKNYDQVSRIGADLLDKQARDSKEKEAFPFQEYPSLNLVLEAAEKAAWQCMDIPLSDSYVPTPMQTASQEESRQYPDWDSLSVKQQVAVIEEIIGSDIRPYIELDAGGIEIVSLTGGRDLVIAYKGACTTCYSSVGSTLQAIQQILSSKVHPELRVIPDSSFLQPPKSLE